MKALELAIHPPILFAAIGAMMTLIDRFIPGLVTGFRFAHAFGAGFTLLSFGIAACAIFEFLRSRTTIDPARPDRASALVSRGIYRLTRNPMYVSLVFALVGWALILDNWLSLALVPLLPFWLTRFQIIPEERALSSRFGEEFERYRRRTRRWV